MAKSVVELYQLLTDSDSERESELQDTSGTTSKTVASLLDRLKAPKESDLFKNLSVLLPHQLLLPTYYSLLM